MKEFTRCHPITNLIYYLFVIGVSVTVMHPLYLVASLIGCLVFYWCTNKNIIKITVTVLFLIVFTAVFNGLFNHAGETILLRFQNGNALTQESIAFGAVSGIMLGCVLIWFLTLTKIMTSEKIMYIFGQVIPSVSLLISMILKFIPEIRKKIKQINQSRDALGIKESKIKRVKTVFKVLVTNSLEDGIVTADSMKARLYGNHRRTNYSNYKFFKKDILIIFGMLIFGGITLFGIISGDANAVYFPKILITNGNIIPFVAFCIAVAMPLIFEAWEGLKWKK